MEKKTTTTSFDRLSTDSNAEREGLIDSVYVQRRPNHRRRWQFQPTALSTSFLGFQPLTHRPSKRLRPFLFILNTTILSLAFIFLFSLCDALFNPSYASPPAQYALLEQAVYSSRRLGRGNPRNEKIFIASNIINADLIRGSWGKSLKRLIDYLGPENVFLSIYENDSGGDTINALRDLQRDLSCDHSIVYGGKLSLFGFPSIVIGTGETRVKRLTYLEEVRNRLLWPLDEPDTHSAMRVNFTSTHYDRILFINDVFFDPVNALQLLFATNYDASLDRADYNAACAIDFNHPAQHYDEFVMRDSEGRTTGWPFFPWFGTSGSAQSRKAVLAESDAVPVSSCWGGMVAFAADEFLRKQVVGYNKDKKKAPSHGYKTNGPLRFRHEPEIYWEAAECCLIHADLAYRKGSEDPKIFVNPYIRTTYTERTWSRLQLARRFERIFSTTQWILSTVWYHDSNPRRTAVPDRTTTQLRWVYDDDELNGEAMRHLGTVYPHKKLSGAWKDVEVAPRPGGFCGERSLFTMKPNLGEANRVAFGKNWEKGDVPKLPKE